MNSHQPEITALHITRFIAAFCVVAYHYGKSAIPFSEGLLHTFIQNGGMAVSYFFALSGFIMTYAYQSNKAVSYKSFLWSRIARIYPVYLFSFILVLLLMYLFKESKPKGISIILQALCMQAWKPGISMEINYVSWSISVEMLFYLLFPFIINYWQKKSINTILFQSILLWLCSLIVHVWMVKNISSPERFNIGQLIAFFPPWHFNSFVLGAAFAIIYVQKLKSWSAHNWLSVALIVLSSILIYLFFIVQPISLGYLTNGGIVPIFLILIVGISLNTGNIKKLLSIKPLIWLGEISYGFYLWQFFIYLFFEKYLMSSSAVMPTSMFYLYIMTLILCAALSYHLLELPLKRFIKNRFVVQRI